MEGVTIFVRGSVQGVGFRWWTRSRALELGLIGFARNMSDGRVEIWAQGTSEAIERLQELIEQEGSATGRPGTIESYVVQPAAPRQDLSGFQER